MLCFNLYNYTSSYLFKNGKIPLQDQALHLQSSKIIHSYQLLSSRNIVFFVARNPKKPKVVKSKAVQEH